MIYIINYDITPEDLSKLIDVSFENIKIDCINYSKKELYSIIDDILGLPEYSVTMIYRRIYISSSYLLNDDIITNIFENYNYKYIFLININTDQERFIFKKFRNKYKYVNCSYNKNKNNILFILKKFMYIKDGNRVDLAHNIFDILGNVRTIFKLISYNLINSDIKPDDFLYNCDILLDLYKYSFNIKNENILDILGGTYISPNYGSNVSFYKSSKSKKDDKSNKGKKKKKKYKSELERQLYEEYNGNIELMAKSVMKYYYANYATNDGVMNKKKNRVNKKENKNDKGVVSLL